MKRSLQEIGMYTLVGVITSLIYSALGLDEWWQRLLPIFTTVTLFGYMKDYRKTTGSWF